MTKILVYVLLSTAWKRMPLHLTGQPSLVPSISHHVSFTPYEGGGLPAYRCINSKLVCVMDSPCKAKALEFKVLFYEALVIEALKLAFIAKDEHGTGREEEEEKIRRGRRGKPRGSRTLRQSWLWETAKAPGR